MSEMDFNHILNPFLEALDNPGRQPFLLDQGPSAVRKVRSKSNAHLGMHAYRRLILREESTLRHACSGVGFGH